MFDILYPRYQITKPIRLIELFGGVGSQAMALRNIGASFEHYRLVEFDKFAIQSYNAIHETDFPTMDITEVKGKDLGITDTDKYEYMMTYSFPCQDLSVAGKGKGMSRDSGTRSGLLWEVERLLDETEHLPQVLLMENVPQVISKKNTPDFEEWCNFLEQKGYYNYYSKLNAKDYGVAQNRNRVFMVSVLGEYSYEFPESVELTKTVKDYLEDEVDEKFYINTEKAKQLISKIDDKYKIGANQVPVDGTINNPKPKDVSNCIKARYDAGIQNQQSVGTMVIEPIVIGGMQKNQSVKTDGVSTTLTSSMGTGGGYVPMIVDDLYLSRPPREYVKTSPTLRHNSGTLKVIEPKIVRQVGRNPNNPSDRTTGAPTEQRLEPNQKGLCNTLTTVQKDNLVLEPKNELKIHTILKGGKWDKIHESARRVYSEDGLCPTIPTCQGGNIEPKVAVKQATQKGYIECKVGGVADLSYPNSKTRRGRVQSEGDVSPTLTATESGICRIEDEIYIDNISDSQSFVKNKTKELYNELGYLPEMWNPYNKSTINNLAPTQTACSDRAGSSSAVLIKKPDYRIRKLTPRECWRLMGFTDEDFHKAESVCSNTQLYKQAGNSIVVPVLETIFKQLLGD